MTISIDMATSLGMVSKSRKQKIGILLDISYDYFGPCILDPKIKLRCAHVCGLTGIQQKDMSNRK